MTPRSKIEVLQVDDTVADLVAATTVGFSRFPIVAGDLDETIGIVHVKLVSRSRRRSSPAPGWPPWPTGPGGAVDPGRRRGDVPRSGPTARRPPWWSTSTAAPRAWSP